MKPLIQFISNEGDQTWLLREDVPKNTDVATTSVSLPPFCFWGLLLPAIPSRVLAPFLLACMVGPRKQWVCGRQQWQGSKGTGSSVCCVLWKWGPAVHKPLREP